MIDRLKVGFHWRGSGDLLYADVTEWWRDPVVLRDLPASLAALVPGAPTLVLGPVSRGSLLGGLVAAHLGVGFVEVRKNDRVSEEWSPIFAYRRLPQEYHGGGATMSFRRGLVRADDRVLCVDDWIESGAQVAAAREMVLEVGATFLGTACIVDDLPADGTLRALLGVRSLLTVDELG